MNLMAMKVVVEWAPRTGTKKRTPSRMVTVLHSTLRSRSEEIKWELLNVALGARQQAEDECQAARVVSVHEDDMLTRIHIHHWPDFFDFAIFWAWLFWVWYFSVSLAYFFDFFSGAWQRLRFSMKNGRNSPKVLRKAVPLEVPTAIPVFAFLEVKIGLPAI